jgi:hypothetical protein
MNIDTRNRSQRAKSAAHSVKLLQPHVPLVGWSNGDQMVYAVNPAYLEIGQGGASPMRGWGAIAFVLLAILALAFLFVAVPDAIQAWRQDQASVWMMAMIVLVGIFMVPLLGVPFMYFAVNFLAVTDPTIRLDHNRQKVWMWTSKGPIEMAWSKLVPRVESSVATAYATVKLYRGQYAELGPDGQPLKTHGIPHVFQCGQISAAEEGVRPSMEYVRLYMEAGPHAVQPPQKLLSHRVRWYAMVNLAGMADDWVRWRENRDKPGVAPTPWVRTVAFVLLFPILFPMQFTNWLALALAPRPKWPKEWEALNAADLSQAQEAAHKAGGSAMGRAAQLQHPRRKPVIRVNGEIIDP